MRGRRRNRKHLLKLVALATGLVLWFYVLNASRVRLEKTVGVEYILPEHLVFLAKPPREVTVTLEGPRAFMRSIAEREERVVIDLSKPSFRDNLRPRPQVREEDLALPFGVRLEKISPRELPLKLERKASKVVPIRYALSGEVPVELELKGLRLTPTEVEVVGPRNLVSGLKELATRPIDVEALYGQQSISLDWLLPDERVVVARPTGPTLHYQLRAKRSNLVLEKIPVRVLGEGSLVREQSATLVLWAPADVVRRADKSDLNVQVWAEIPDTAKGPTEVVLRAVLPPRLHLVEVRPKRILVQPR